MALLPVDEARTRILDGVKPLASETLALDQAMGRVLAKPVIAKRDQPPFAASAMDGYAFRHQDVEQVPSSLKIIGTSGAGHAFKGTLKPGTAVRILTGAPVPSGADTIVIQENTTRDGDLLQVLQATPKGKNIRRAALDFAKGDELLTVGTKLRARDMGLAAAANAPKLQVRKQPHVALFTTGDELVLPGQKARPDQIYSSNSHAIAALAQQFGARVSNLGIIPDHPAATRRAVTKALSADIVLTTGGASVGDHDYVQGAFKACGVNIGFWKIAMRPGKPFMYGRKGKTHVMGLPGNPVSALITARLFLRPLIARLLDCDDGSDAPVLAELTAAMPANDDRQDYVRATLTVEPDGRRKVAPFAMQDSSMQRTLQLATALIIRPAHAPAASPGDVVPLLLLDF